TTICDWLAGEARDTGAVVCWGRCLEGDAAPPYGPWLQVLRAWAEQAGPVGAAAAFGPSAELLARLVPELVAGADVAAATELPGTGAQYLLIEALGEVVARLGRGVPLLVVLDDLQWADPSSLLVAESVGRAIVESPVLLLAAYRDNELPA